ncbi:unnamed protein product, partial [Rotaria sp. Silwood2]
MSTPQYYQTRSKTKIDKTISELSSDLSYTHRMASSHSDQLTTTSEISQSINNKQAENPILKSKSSQYKEENVSFNEQFSIIDEHHSV